MMVLTIFMISLELVVLLLSFVISIIGLFIMKLQSLKDYMVDGMILNSAIQSSLSIKFS
jgi:hypothetical protein